MSKCKCENPHTYRESLAQQAKDNGGLLAVAPMMGMDECLNCWNANVRVNTTVKMSNTELALLFEELRE